MRVWISGALLAWAPVVAMAESGFEEVITAQIRAFEQQDLAAAFVFASPAIQRLFADAERFGLMVRRGYPMLWRPAEVRFLAPRVVAGQHWQRALVRDRAGVLHILDYQMLRIGADWRINAVQILPAQDAGV